MLFVYSSRWALFISSTVDIRCSAISASFWSKLFICWSCSSSCSCSCCCCFVSTVSCLSLKSVTFDCCWRWWDKMYFLVLVAAAAMCLALSELTLVHVPQSNFFQLFLQFIHFPLFVPLPLVFNITRVWYNCDRKQKKNTDHLHWVFHYPAVNYIHPLFPPSRISHKCEAISMEFLPLVLQLQCKVSKLVYEWKDKISSQEWKWG